MDKQKSSPRWPRLLGVLLLIAGPTTAGILARQGIEPAWLARAIAAVMAIVAISLIVRSLPLRQNERT